MFSFKTFLIEMNVADAKSVLGVSGTFTDVDLKKAYRTASSKNHPDKGGSTEAMQKVNQAYEMLKAHVGVQTEIDNREKMKQESRDLAVMVRNDLVKNVDITSYRKHFEETFSESFITNVTKIYPTDADIQKLERVRNSFLGSDFSAHVSYDIEFKNATSTKVFTLSIHVSMLDLRRAGGLASPGTTYPMYVTTFSYVDGRNLKVSAQNWNHTSKKSVFTTPESVFPKKKINRSTKAKFKKSDMLAALKAEIRAESTGKDMFMVPLAGGQYISVVRHTMSGMGFWGVSSITTKSDKGWFVVDKSIKTKFMTLPENEDTLNIFKKIKTMNATDAQKYIESAYQTKHR